MSRLISSVGASFLAVALIAAITQPAAASFLIGATSVTGSLGLASAEAGLGSTFQLGGRADVGMFSQELLLEAGFHYWKKSYGAGSGSIYYTDTAQASVRDLALLSGVRYMFATFEGGLQPYGRAGVGMHFASVSFGGSSSFGSTDLGFYLGGGVQYPVAPRTRIGADLAYHVTDVDHFMIGAQVTQLLGR